MMAIVEPWPQLQNFTPYPPALNLNAGGPLLCSAGRSMYFEHPKFDMPRMHLSDGTEPLETRLHVGDAETCQTCGWLYR